MKLKWQDNNTKSPLARARGLGSSHHGTGHWMHQRVTAISNLLLMFWLVCAVVRMTGFTHVEIVQWLQDPLNAVLMILAILSTTYHAALGAQVIVEDYIHCEAFKTLKLIGMKLFFVAIAVASIFSILKIAFGA